MSAPNGYQKKNKEENEKKRFPTVFYLKQEKKGAPPGPAKTRRGRNPQKSKLKGWGPNFKKTMRQERTTQPAMRKRNGWGEGEEATGEKKTTPKAAITFEKFQLMNK